MQSGTNESRTSDQYNGRTVPDGPMFVAPECLNNSMAINNRKKSEWVQPSSVTLVCIFVRSQPFTELLRHPT
jgi:hypothetical protein